MASARSTLMNLFTRLLMRLLFRAGRSLIEFRTTFARMDRHQKLRLPDGIRIEDVEAPRPGRWFRNASASPNPQTILYLHGGAFMMRLPNGHGSMVARICRRAGVQAFMPWYRLTPEHPFPAAPEDCLAAYRDLLDSGLAAQDIVVMGDSAGGNLALVLPHLIRRAALPMPSGVIALSPITDFAQISATWRLNTRRDPMYRVQGYVNPVEHYLCGASPLDPIASPYYGELRGFPPLFLLVGGLEALLDDSVGMVRKAIEQGVPARVQIWGGMPHVFPLTTQMPEAALGLDQIAGWMDELRNGLRRDPAEPWRDCVELMERQAFTGRLRRQTNSVFLTARAAP